MQQRSVDAFAATRAQEQIANGARQIAG